MSEPTVKCPVCGVDGAFETAIEVDIGVGVQKHVLGYECPKCGQLPVCSSCGAINDHMPWCPVLSET